MHLPDGVHLLMSTQNQSVSQHLMNTIVIRSWYKAETPPNSGINQVIQLTFYVCHLLSPPSISQSNKCILNKLPYYKWWHVVKA